MEFVLFSVIILGSIVTTYVYLSKYLNSLESYSNNVILEEKANKVQISFLKFKLFNYSNYSVFFYENGYITCKNITYYGHLSRGKDIYNFNTYIICDKNRRYNIYEGVTYW